MAERLMHLVLSECRYVGAWFIVDQGLFALAHWHLRSVRNQAFAATLIG